MGLIIQMIGAAFSILRWDLRPIETIQVLFEEIMGLVVEEEVEVKAVIKDLVGGMVNVWQQD